MAKDVKCGYCGGIIAYDPYSETIGGTQYTFRSDWARRLIRRGGPEDTDTNGKGCKVWLLRRHHSLRSLLGDNRRKEVHVPCQAVRGRVQSAQVRILRRGYRLRALRRNHRKEGNDLPRESLRRRLQEETAPSRLETRFDGE